MTRQLWTVASFLAVTVVLGAQEPLRLAALAQGEAAPANPLGQPLVDSGGGVREDAFIHIPLLPEDRKYADLDGRRMKQFVMEIDAISLKDRDSGNLFWGRNVGTAGHAAAEEWVETYFRRHSLRNIHREVFDLQPQWTPKSFEITFAAGAETFKLASARPAQRMPSTPPGGLELDVMWLAGGSAADYIGRDVKGKAVLIQDVPLPGDIRHSIQLEGSVARAFEKGAAAVGIVFGISDNFAIWQSTAGRAGFNVGYEDGMKIRELLGQGRPVKVRMRLDAEMRPGLKTASVVGTLPGAGASMTPGAPGNDEDVTIIAHIDGYFQAALDNASGMAVMIGLVEHYAKLPQSARRRNIRFIGSAGHHGGPGARWLHDRRDAELAKTALAINLEHVAAVRTKYWGPKLRKTTAVSPMRWWLNGSPKLLDITVAAFNRFNVGVTADMDPGASGEMGSLARDVATLQVITSPEIKHTEQDTPEWVPAVGLEQIARAYAKIIDEANKLDRRQIQPAQPASGRLRSPETLTQATAGQATR
jgi:peptidase M28-like protein